MISFFIYYKKKGCLLSQATLIFLGKIRFSGYFPKSKQNFFLFSLLHLCLPQKNSVTFFVIETKKVTNENSRKYTSHATPPFSD